MLCQVPVVFEHWTLAILSEELLNPQNLKFLRRWKEVEELGSTVCDLLNSLWVLGGACHVQGLTTVYHLDIYSFYLIKGKACLQVRK